jgi:predicted nucleic-acid-binding protein
MRAIDTNVLVRLIARDDAAQTDVADRFVADGAWVSTIVLAEAIWVLQSVYGRSSQEISAIVERLLDADKIALQDADAVAASLVQFRQRSSVGFPDCLILECARKAGHLPLATFDRALAKLPGVERLSS